MNVYLLGAGASKSYEDSVTRQKMPLATDFFTTFSKLDISASGWVLIGHIVNYVKENRGVDEFSFNTFNEDIEHLHTEIKEKLMISIEEHSIEKIGKYMGAYNQLILLFCSVINEIQNGPESLFHNNLVSKLNKDDVIITFNWDTLIDRALKNHTSWKTKNGYFIKPIQVYNNKWFDSGDSKEGPLLLKLHGSTNWLSSYIYYDYSKEKISFLHDGPINNFFVYEDTISPYPCYDGRFMGGYSEFSMGYYPPNLPYPLINKKYEKGRVAIKLTQRYGTNPAGNSSKEGIESMPIIIPPVLNKSYDFYGDLFEKIWNKAESELVKADKIFILGYSFPITDIQSSNLFKDAFLKRKTIPEIFIINPEPDKIERKFKYEFGIPEHMIHVEKCYIDKNYIIPV